MTRERDRKSIWAVNLGLGVNIILSVVKTVVGVIGHSPALLAEGINSVSDVAYYVVAGIFVRLANKPADIEHPYGHRQLESIASLVVGAFVVSTAVVVFWDSRGQNVGPAGWADDIPGRQSVCVMDRAGDGCRQDHPVLLRPQTGRGNTKSRSSSPWPTTTAMIFSPLLPLPSASSLDSVACPGWTRWPARWLPC